MPEMTGADLFYLGLMIGLLLGTIQGGIFGYLDGLAKARKERV